MIYKSNMINKNKKFQKLQYNKQKQKNIKIISNNKRKFKKNKSKRNQNKIMNII